MLNRGKQLSFITVVALQLSIVLTAFASPVYANETGKTTVVVDAFHHITASSIPTMTSDGISRGFQLEVDDGVFNTVYHHFVYAGSSNFPVTLTAGTAKITFDANGVSGGTYTPANEPEGTSFTIKTGQEGRLLTKEGDEILVFVPQWSPGIANWTGNLALVSKDGGPTNGKFVFQYSATILYVVTYQYILLSVPDRYSFTLTRIS